MRCLWIGNTGLLDGNIQFKKYSFFPPDFDLEKFSYMNCRGLIHVLHKEGVKMGVRDEYSSLEYKEMKVKRYRI